MFYFHDNDTPSYGWWVDDHRIYGPCGYSQRLNDHITSSLLRYGKMSDSAILSRVGIVQNYRGKKRLAVEGSPFWDEACLNTEGMKNPIPISSLQRGQRYLSNKGEDFVWLGEVYIKTFPAKKRTVAKNGDETDVLRCRVVNKTILARFPLNQPQNHTTIRPVTDDFTVIRHLGGGRLWKPGISYWTGGDCLASAIVSLDPIPRKKTVVINPTYKPTRYFTLNDVVYVANCFVSDHPSSLIRARIYRVNGWDNLERAYELPEGEIIPVTVEFVYGDVRTKVSTLCF